MRLLSCVRQITSDAEACGNVSRMNLGASQGGNVLRLGSIRTKTHTASIRELVDRVAALPPISPVLKPMWPAAQGVMH